MYLIIGFIIYIAIVFYCEHKRELEEIKLFELDAREDQLSRDMYYDLTKIIYYEQKEERK